MNANLDPLDTEFLCDNGGGLFPNDQRCAVGVRTYIRRTDRNLQDRCQW